MKKIIITGGAGYIGSHCVLSLVKNGYIPIIQYLENLTDNKTKTIITNDINYINNSNPDKIIFLLNPSTVELFERVNMCKFKTNNFSFLQLEPLTLQCHLNSIITYFNNFR